MHVRVLGIGTDQDYLSSCSSCRCASSDSPRSGAHHQVRDHKARSLATDQRKSRRRAMHHGDYEPLTPGAGQLPLTIVITDDRAIRLGVCPSKHAFSAHAVRGL